MLLSPLVAFIHLASGIPPAPLILVRAFLVTAAVSLAVCLLLTRLRSAQAAVAAIGFASSVFGLFPSARELFVTFITAEGAGIFSLVYLLGCVLIAVAVFRSRPTDLLARYETIRRMSVLVWALILSLLVYYYGINRERAFVQDAASDDLDAIAPPIPTPPDVYHIVLDGFGRPDVLSAMYGVDVSDVVRDLKARGFEVADESGAANYTQTYLSLASMLNTRYLDSLARQIPDSRSRVPLATLIQHSTVLEAFKRFDYKILFVGSIYSATQRHRLADRCECDYPFIGEFESMIVQSTPFGELGLAGLDHRPHRNKLLRSFEVLESVAPSETPRFLFAHIMAPHPPFVFDATGGEIEPWRVFSLDDGTMYRGTRAEYEHGYREQVKYIARRIFRAIDHLEDVSRAMNRESVIIIHGDHGPRARFHALDATQTDVSESTPVLLAIRWARTGAPDPMVTSLVNIYRSFFRRYYGATLELLPNRFFVSSFLKPYQFLEVDPANIRSRDVLAHQAR